jgi:tetraacyldisaccharide 4'-kinase
MKRSLRPAVLARGYKGAMVDGEWINDEGILLRESIPGLAVVQDPDRLAAAQRAVSLHGADLLILDDGFQHRRIGRGVDVVALDARRPFGNGRLLPAGLLREPMSSIRRADALVLTRCECVDEESLKKTEELVKWISRGVPLFRAVHEAAGVRTVSGEVLELSDLDGKRLYLFAGIADPGHFERTAASTGCRAVKIRSFPDHHRYRWEDVFRIVREGQDAGAEGFLTTAKDAVKLKAFSEAQDILVLDIAVRFLDGEEAFRNLVFGRKA